MHNCKDEIEVHTYVHIHVVITGETCGVSEILQSGSPI